MNHALDQLANLIPTWARELGFQQTGITDTDLHQHKQPLDEWLKNNYHGEMEWMARHADMRVHPEKLVEHACRVISVRMNYLPGDTQAIRILKSPEKAYISRYALGRDYHKLIRKRLAQLADQIRHYAEEHQLIDALQQRPFVDSAPVLERPLAEKAGLGWVGKHTLLIHQEAGSWFFLGELLTNLPLPTNHERAKNHCGECSACLKVCPTDAFPRPYQLDARRCISYLTIENKGPIAEEFRHAMGNRVFGCDDCQAICPWNKYAHTSDESHFSPRHNFDAADLTTLFSWDEATYLDKTAGSPIRRIGYQNWLRNLAIGLGNAPQSAFIVQSLQKKRQEANSLVAEHIDWAIAEQTHPKRRRRRKIRRAADDDQS